MPWQELAEKPLFKPKSQALLLSEPKPSMMVLSRQPPPAIPPPATPRLAQNGGCPNSWPIVAVDVSITPTYKGPSRIPAGITINAQGSGGFFENITLLNPPGM